MAANTGKLAGKTVFITGASRGIGKAIALKVAKDGANVVIAAKTAEAHPKLPGTIYTAAEEVNKAGGKGFPCIVDIRNEEQVQEAVKQTVAKFGGIDILVNNASAISLTPTLATPMKKYDLMNGVNARGTYLCSQACLPYLLKSPNPHILNISPPLNMSPKWFAGHVAYTMAKYGMSMCALGMAEEFRDQGVAVNALWPRTAIWTAAMEMIGGGSGVKEQCRKVDIMSDAAYVIFSRESRKCTGNFFIDDEVLKSVGVSDSDIENYACVPGKTLLPDFFLDTDAAAIKSQIKTEASPKESSSGVAQTFKQIESLLSEDLVKDMKASYQFDLSGDNSGTWFLDLKNGSGSLGQGPLENADCNMTLDSKLFLDMFAGKASATTAFMSGKLKIKGDLKAAMKLEKLMNNMRKSKL
ncbi:hydroxysteroid dehydrogenase-like protein 2 [Physella acuta]|uniref:hydroxysteroid dehydrogenase-like protein 2 n=1 Tax=Physella acuta TaxID=109671 RepID=UPI0027DCB83B|nr:hydroxysteroid dehydrogenase-like protein 2 [Physella acuta]